MKLKSEKKAKTLGERATLTEVLSWNSGTRLYIDYRTGVIKSMSDSVDFKLVHDLKGHIDFDKSNLSVVGVFTHPKPPKAERDVRLLLTQLKMEFPNTTNPVLKTFSTKIENAINLIRSGVHRDMTSDPTLGAVLTKKPTTDLVKQFYAYFNSKLPKYPVYVKALVDKHYPSWFKAAANVVKAISDPDVGTATLNHGRSMRLKDPDVSKFSAMGGKCHIGGVMNKQVQDIAYIGRYRGRDAGILADGYQGDLTTTPIILVGVGSDNLTHCEDLQIRKEGFPTMCLSEKKNSH
jgi:hypothetical protein